MQYHADVSMAAREEINIWYDLIQAIFVTGKFRMLLLGSSSCPWSARYSSEKIAWQAFQLKGAKIQTESTCHTNQIMFIHTK